MGAAAQLNNASNEIQLYLFGLFLAVFVGFHAFEKYRAGKKNMLESLILIFCGGATIGILIALFAKNLNFFENQTVIFFKDKLIIYCNHILPR